MDQTEANTVVTSKPTPEGQQITTDTVFDLFAALVPDSPWAKRLLKIKTVFNHLATGCTMLTTIHGWSLGDQVYSVKEREALGWDGPNVKQFGDATKEICHGLQMLSAKPIEVEALPELDEPINIDGLLATVGAIVHKDQPSEDNPEPMATIHFTGHQFTLFLYEYRRQLIEGE